MSDKPPYSLLLDWMTESLALAPTAEPVASGVLWNDGGVITLSVGIPPAFSDHPDDASVTQGSTATFSVTASNATSYQWQKQESGAGAWSNISGATSSSYTTGALTVAADNTDKYRCVATGAGGTTTSNTATLTVNPAVPSLGTKLFDEDFSVPIASLPSNSAAATSTGVGQILYFNVAAGDSVTGGALQFAGSTNLIISDNAASRARLAGRIHYLKAVTSGTDFVAWNAVGISGTNGATNFWASGKHDPGIMVHNAGDIRDNRGYLTNNSGNTYDRGNYQIKSYVTTGQTLEFALLERGSAGTLSLMRINGGNWRIVCLERLSTATGRWNSWNNAAAGVDYYSRLMTANTAYVPTMAVCHSFASATGPSDGAGQQETGSGSGVAAVTSGSVTITSSTLRMSADGSGFVVFDHGQTDWVAHAEMVVYDGSPASVIVRYQDASNYLYAQIDSTANNMKLVEVVAGTPTTLQTIALNPGTTDTWNVADATTVYWTWRDDGSKLIVSLAPGTAHDTYIESTTTRFAGSTKCGVLVNKGAGVNSSTAKNFVVFPAVQTLPVFA